VPIVAPPRVVIDTNVLFEGLTKQGGAAGLIIDVWRAGLLHVSVSTALAYEYADALSRKLSAARWQRLQPVLGALLAGGVRPDFLFLATAFSRSRR